MVHPERYLYYTYNIFCIVNPIIMSTFTPTHRKELKSYKCLKWRKLTTNQENGKGITKTKKMEKGLLKPRK